MKLAGITIVLTLQITVWLHESATAHGHDELLLPHKGSDIIVYVNDAGRRQKVSGSIEDIRGDRLVFRPNGSGPVQRIDMARLAQLVFRRGVDWDAALALMKEGDDETALERITKEIESETRPWAWAEAMALAARLEIQLGRRDRAVSRIELIRSQDTRTRHMGLAPFVWDESLPQHERLQLPLIRLTSRSPLIRVAAASAWLHDPANRPGAVHALQEVAAAEGASLIGRLARAQLWRLHLLENPGQENPVLDIWRESVEDLPPGARGGPQFVLARNLESVHDYDRAALSYLWTPTMTPWDPALSANSMRRAIICLKKAGRHAEASQMASELKQTYPKTSAARHQPDSVAE